MTYRSRTSFVSLLSKPKIGNWKNICRRFTRYKFAEAISNKPFGLGGRVVVVWKIVEDSVRSVRIIRGSFGRRTDRRRKLGHFVEAESEVELTLKRPLICRSNLRRRILASTPL